MKSANAHEAAAVTGNEPGAEAVNENEAESAEGAGTAPVTGAEVKIVIVVKLGPVERGPEGENPHSTGMSHLRDLSTSHRCSTRLCKPPDR
jgi:hypothetical protein